MVRANYQQRSMYFQLVQQVVQKALLDEAAPLKTSLSQGIQVHGAWVHKNV